jgi:MFS family permease
MIGGAATYIAESCPARHRGFYTSFLQITATLGLLVSLVVILAVKSSMSNDAFSNWGWRIPFLVSAILILLSFYIRRKMHESPVYARAKAKAAKNGNPNLNPLKEAFTKPRNLYYVTLALFGAVMGMACIW